ncbi:hypothetical protein K469DRAFT_611191 [Zopfia rhizophila CBS 207.26]|uniref:Uncharacterized protein n=1 Tax=Zopfia rhizophila CBS 207.26 TaxID=1314779 RepID=A0A6A6D737_9PEZI|nr:hypothetical protein K469DRAFT_611191 [Zopfia rhizophila CBS 207.26]
MKRFPEPESPIVVKDAFPFEQLPAEIRNNVYRDLLIIKFPMMLVHDRPSFPDLDVPSFTLYPAILCTNKKIHNEAAAILYSENTFYVHVDTPVETFLDPYWQQANWSEMVLKPSIGLHAGFIKRVVMCSKDKGEIRDYMEIEARLLAIGIELCELLLWAIKFSDEETMEMNAMVNQGWLKKVEATELKKHHTWFPNTNELGDWTKGIWLMKREGAKSTAA